MTPIPHRLAAALAPRYRVERELGSGGMATVYLAEDLKHRRMVAAKVLRPELAASLGPERFLREIAIAAKLQHPHILPLHDSGEADGLLYYVMPFVDGESLRERVAREARLSVPETVRIVREVVDALAYAHANGVVHRDIKPENVMLSGRHALVADFGVAKAVSEAGRADGVTAVGMAVGTPAYMAPEQAAADPATDHRADLYAVGTLAYELLTGRLPFTATTPQGVLAAQLTTPPEPIESARPGLPARLAAIIMRCLEKDPERRWPSAEALLAELETIAVSGESPGATVQVSGISSRRAGVRLAWGAGALVVVLGALGLAGYRARMREAGETRWARDVAIPAIRQYADSGQADSAFQLARQAIARAPWVDTALTKTWPKFSALASIRSIPESATLAWAPLTDSQPTWVRLGVTPLESLRIPRLARLKVEKPGFRALETVFSAIRGQSESFILRPLDEPDDGMVAFPAESIQIYLSGLDHLPVIPLEPFRIGRAEVTNREFARFVESGGYGRKEYWTDTLVLEGRSVAWDAAMARFTDRTGRPGPATWEGGRYPSGQADHPVAGVSWYEAAAYARYAGKSLPTLYHWSSAAFTPMAAALVPRSNFSGKGSAPVGSYPGLGPYGVRDFAGNVREWCLNATGGERYVLGGGWGDPEYSFTDGYAQAPDDRSPINGIRLAEYAEGDSSLAMAARPVARAFRDYGAERPAPDAAFAIYRRQFDYDRRPLNPVAEGVDSSAEDWIREKITVDAAYGAERLPIYLFLPRGRKPPYQTMVYFPGSNALHIRSSEAGLEHRSFDFIVKSGRAVVYPVYKSTYERGDSTLSDYADESNRYREHVLMWGKDLRRAIDYVESRPDLAGDAIGYYGVSWGGALGGIWPAVEPRLKVSVLLVAGLGFPRSQPEADVFNYLPRIRIPVLMLNGQYDFFFPVETSQKPMFRLLGTPPEHKRQIISSGGHFVPRTQLIGETLAWLDRYLGPVE